MKRIWIPLILFLVVVLEGVALDLLPENFVTGEWMIIPHWVLVILVYVSVFYDKEHTYVSVLYGIVFGLLIDIVYTSVLGIYMFTYAVVIYIIHGLKKMLHANFHVTVLLGFLGIVIADIFLYVIYMVIGFTDMVWNDYLFYRLIPTVLANLLFLIIIYPFLQKRLAKWQTKELSQSK